MITHRFPYSEFEQGFEGVTSGQAGKICAGLDQREVILLELSPLRFREL